MKSSISIVRTSVNVVSINLETMDIVKETYHLFVGDTSEWTKEKVFKALSKEVNTDGMKYVSHATEKALVTIDHADIWEHGTKDFDGYRK